MVSECRGSERLTSCLFGAFLRGFVGIKNARMRMLAGVDGDFCYLLASLESGLIFVALTFLLLLVTTSSRSCCMVTERCFFSSGKT